MFIAFTLFSLLNAFILFSSSGKKNRGNTYLALLFICVTLRSLTAGIALKALPPFLQKTFYNNLSPVFFLFGPILYFYIRHEVLEISFKLKRDFVHLLIFFISVINMIPYYMNFNNFKPEYIELTRQNPFISLYHDYWWFNSPVYFIGGPILTLIYLTLSLYTVSTRNQLLSKKISASGYEELIKWLYFIIIIFYAFSTSNLIFASYVYLTGNQLYMIPPIVTGILFLYLNAQIYKYPQVLFGIKFSKSPKTKPINHFNQAKPPIVIESDFESKFNQRLEQYRLSKEYLAPDFTMETMAKDLEIPEYIFKNYFKDHLKVKFKDLRNELRIGHFCETVGKEDLKRYTANALAQKFGFSDMKSLKKAFDMCQPESYETFHSKLMSQ
jgi:AraC-like DNA-binding protein